MIDYLGGCDSLKGMDDTGVVMTPFGDVETLSHFGGQNI